MTAIRKHRRQLERAVALHNAADLPAAAALYERLVAANPGEWEPAFLLGVLRLQQRNMEAARALLERAAQLNARHTDAWVALADAELGLGQAQRALAASETALRLAPDNARVLFRRALSRERLADWAAAEADYERIVALEPAFAEAWNNLGNARRALGRIESARAAYGHALERSPGFAQAHHNLAVLLEIEFGALQEAVPHYRRAVELAPDYAEAHCHLGAALWTLGHGVQAVECYEKALALRPDYPEVLNNLGLVYAHESLFAEAGACYRRALEGNPGFFQAHNNLGFLLLRLEQPAQAEAAFRAAAAIAPDAPEVLNGLGMALKEQGRAEEAAASFEQAVALQPGLAQAWANLGEVRAALGQTESAVAALLEADRVKPNAGLRLRAAIVLPPVMTGVGGIEHSRARVDAALDDLLEGTFVADEGELLAHADTPFFLAYHGRNDRALLGKLAAAVAQMTPQLLAPSRHCLHYAGPGGRIRVGVVSRFCHNHSVGNFFNPVLARIATDPGFEVTLLTVGMKSDEVLERFAAACQAHVRLGDSLDRARRTIAQCGFDLLVYPEIGMDAFTWFLSFARLAPAQCVLHGHSNTTGVPAVDYFVSSRLIEPDDGQDHYSEELIRLESLMMHLEPVHADAPRQGREALGLDPGARLYVCPMKLQKLHPEMDAAFLGILERDPAARIVLFDDDRHRAWRDQVVTRLAARLGGRMARVTLRPWAPLPEFVSILAAGDAVLDSFHHGGATTANICLSAGIPMVTWPGPTARGRGLLGYYRLLGIDECIAASRDGFVDLAVRLAHDPDARRRIGARILERLPRLHDNEAVYREYARAFRRMVARSGEMRERAGHGGRSYFRKFTLGSYADLAAAGCASVQPLALPRTATTVRPCYAGETAPPTMISEAPEARVVAIDGASVHGEHDLVSTGGRAVLEMAEHPGFDRFNYLSGAVPFMDRNEVVVHSLRRHPANVGQAFWLGGLGSSNYFHWVVEFLPRLMGFEGHVPTGLPLLLDERTAAVPQLMEALAACLERVPEVVRIKRMARCDVGRLWTATHPSWLPFDYRPDCGLEATDQRLSDAALRWVRERLRTAAGASARCGRRLYVPRAGTKFRRIVNEHELGALLQEHGFESVHPERLGALEQVRTFAQADVIVAPSGAALTNVLFASPGARLVCLLPEAWREFSVYSTLAAVAGVSSRFVGGQVVAGSFPIPYQCDYWVDMGQLREALAWAA